MEERKPGQTKSPGRQEATSASPLVALEGEGKHPAFSPPPHTSYQRSHGPPPYCRCAGAAESAGPRGGLAGRPGGWRRQARQQAGGCGQGFSRSSRRSGGRGGGGGGGEGGGGGASDRPGRLRPPRSLPKPPAVWGVGGGVRRQQDVLGLWHSHQVPGLVWCRTWQLYHPYIDGPQLTASYCASIGRKGRDRSTDPRCHLGTGDSEGERDRGADAQPSWRCLGVSTLWVLSSQEVWAGLLASLLYG